MPPLWHAGLLVAWPQLRNPAWPVGTAMPSDLTRAVPAPCTSLPVRRSGTRPVGLSRCRREPGTPANTHTGRPGSRHARRLRNERTAVVIESSGGRTVQAWRRCLLADLRTGTPVCRPARRLPGTSTSRPRLASKRSSPRRTSAKLAVRLGFSACGGSPKALRSGLSAYMRTCLPEGLRVSRPGRRQTGIQRAWHGQSRTSL
jgi:hypothetical protein